VWTARGRIEEAREPDAVRFGDQSKEGPVAIEAPGAARPDHFETGLVVPVEKLVSHAACWVFIGELEGFGAEPLDVDDRDGGVQKDAADGGRGEEGFELGHPTTTTRAKPPVPTEERSDCMPTGFLRRKLREGQG
jgi:hypothetical protein